MTRVYRLFILILMVLMGVVQAQDSQPVFRIGVLDSERGPITQGARLAVKELNDAGGVRGAEGTMFRLELVIQPTPEGDDLLFAIENIERARVIAVLGPQTTEDVLNNLPLLQDLNVPILTPAIGDTVIASDSTGVLFRIRGAERLLGSALAGYVTEELNVSSIYTVQLDRNSTAARVGFSVALSQLPNRPDETTLVLDNEEDLIDIVQEILSANPPIVAAFGPPELTGEFYTTLRDNGWAGTFAYNDAAEEAFRTYAPPQQMLGVLGTVTWPVSAVSGPSAQFIDSFVTAFAEAPGPIEAASYDAVYLLAEAIGQPGDLRTNLQQLRDVPGVQGTLNPTGLATGETNDTVAVIQLNALGGYDVVARYAATQRIPLEEEDIINPPISTRGTATPVPTATPDGVVITIESNVQNVRTGPGLEYDVLGQLRQGEQARVIGATADFSWVVIEFRGQQGWLATYLLDVFGDRSRIPVIAAPPTPTPRPATTTPTAGANADIIIAAASPANITLGTLTNINITVRNVGGVAAGPFAIAATFEPDDVFTAVNLPGLAAGAEAIIQLPVTLTSNTGNYAVAIVADLNNQVPEGPAGEANNTAFTFNYRVDRQLILVNNVTLSAGASVDLEGNVTPVPDISYTAAGLNTVSNCTGTAYCIGLLSPSLNWDTAHYDSITSANGINTTFIANTGLGVGSVIGVLTGEGRRGVLRVDAINPGVSITLTYRIYQ
ncbi:MAG: hypothetical protein OHK0046_04120 [Anaerolineae bacterium]